MLFSQGLLCFAGDQLTGCATPLPIPHRPAEPARLSLRQPRTILISLSPPPSPIFSLFNRKAKLCSAEAGDFRLFPSWVQSATVAAGCGGGRRGNCRNCRGLRRNTAFFFSTGQLGPFYHGQKNLHFLLCGGKKLIAKYQHTWALFFLRQIQSIH